MASLRKKGKVFFTNNKENGKIIRYHTRAFKFPYSSSCPYLPNTEGSYRPYYWTSFLTRLIATLTHPIHASAADTNEAARR